MGWYLHLKFFEDPEFWIKYSWGFQREQIPLFEAHLGFTSYLIFYLVHLVAPDEAAFSIWSTFKFQILSKCVFSTLGGSSED